MKNYLIDTNVIIDYLRQNAKISLWFNQLKRPQISVITAAELYQGVRNKTQLRAIRSLIDHFMVLPIDPNTSFLAISLLEKYFLSQNLLILDALIAATAIENDLFLVTDNSKHFKFIPSLKLIASVDVI